MHSGHGGSVIAHAFPRFLAAGGYCRAALATPPACNELAIPESAASAALPDYRGGWAARGPETGLTIRNRLNFPSAAGSGEISVTFSPLAAVR